MPTTSHRSMPSLPITAPQPSSQNALSSTRRQLRKASKAVMRSHHLRIPKYDMPIRLRPWFLIFTCIVMIMLAMLGFTNFSRSLPLHDKLLHFMCFCLATGVFYFIFDVEEDARRIWFWRHSGLIFTAIVCFFFGGIVSEIVQSMLPYKTFDFGDVMANLLGSGIGLYAAYYMERYYRHRREISRLYRPLNTDYLSDSDEEDSAQLLPSHYIPTNSRPGGSKPNVTKPIHNNLSDIWDEREELFDIGRDSDDENTGGASGERGRPVAPKITISNADSGP